jgi:flavin-dependent dehydrogenase
MNQADVIVVGARCAGATLATLLARAGVRTMLLDADGLPSDMPMSTHLIHPPGIDVLDEIGVGEAVRACTPATRVLRLRVQDADLYSSYPQGRASYCTRRVVVDRLLQDAAVAAGAELRDRHRVIDLVRDGERVAGVEVETPQGRQTLRANLVVGADGRHSRVARLTGVEEYLQFSMTRGGYFFYFPTPDIWREDPRYAGYDMYIGWEGDGLRYIFQCDGDRLLMVAGASREEASGWGADYRAKSLAYMAQSEVLRPLVEASEPLGRGIGILKYDCFYRRPVGPGFALVGDAGTAKDFVTGHGMAEAFLDARRLAAAILDGSDNAYQRFWLQRDVESLPLYFNAQWLGDIGFNDGVTSRVIAEQARKPQFADRICAVNDRSLSAFDAFPPRVLLSALSRAVLAGKLDVVPKFFRTGARLRREKHYYNRRVTQLRALPA